MIVEQRTKAESGTNERTCQTRMYQIDTIDLAHRQPKGDQTKRFSKVFNSHKENKRMDPEFQFFRPPMCRSGCVANRFACICAFRILILEAILFIYWGFACIAGLQWKPQLWIWAREIPFVSWTNHWIQRLTCAADCQKQNDRPHLRRSSGFPKTAWIQGLDSSADLLGGTVWLVALIVHSVHTCPPNWYV